VTHTAARQLLRGHGPRDHITPTLQQLHWQVSTSILEPLKQNIHGYAMLCFQFQITPIVQATRLIFLYFAQTGGLKVVPSLSHDLRIEVFERQFANAHLLLYLNQN